MFKSLITAGIMLVSSTLYACDTVCNSCVQQVVVPSYVELVSTHDKYYVVVPQQQVVVQKVVANHNVRVVEQVRVKRNVERVKVLDRGVRNVRLQTLREMFVNQASRRANRKVVVEKVRVEKVHVHH